MSYESINIEKEELDCKDIKMIESEQKLEPEPIKKIPSKEAKEFMERYGELKRKNSLLVKKAKRFDSADYFQARASQKKLN